MDWFGNIILKMNLMIPERGEWKGVPGMKAANDAVSTKKSPAITKTLSRSLPVVGYASQTD
jgi:hypothetical protein